MRWGVKGGSEQYALSPGAARSVPVAGKGGVRQDAWADVLWPKDLLVHCEMLCPQSLLDLQWRQRRFMLSLAFDGGIRWTIALPISRCAGSGRFG